jgi:hypothetical protein
MLWNAPGTPGPRQILLYILSLPTNLEECLISQQVFISAMISWSPPSKASPSRYAEMIYKYMLVEEHVLALILGSGAKPPTLSPEV